MLMLYLIVALVIVFVILPLLQRRFFPELSKPDSTPYKPIGRQRSPRGASAPNAEDPLGKTAEFQIHPGERIGPFRLNAAWDELDSMLTGVYEEIDRGATLVMMAKPLTFDVDRETGTVTSITAWSGFEGAMKEGIRIGHSLARVKELLGCRVIRLNEKNEARLEGVDGIAILIEGGWYEGWKGEAALRQEIGAIRIFVPGSESITANDRLTEFI